MKTYIVKVIDTSENVDYLIARAKQALREKKDAFAAIYGYRDVDGKKTYFAKPLVKYSQDDVMQFAKALLNGKKGTDKIIYAIYRDQLEEA